MLTSTDIRRRGRGEITVLRAGSLKTLEHRHLPRFLRGSMALAWDVPAPFFTCAVAFFLLPNMMPRGPPVPGCPWPSQLMVCVWWWSQRWIGRSELRLEESVCGLLLMLFILPEETGWRPNLYPADVTETRFINTKTWPERTNTTSCKVFQNKSGLKIMSDDRTTKHSDVWFSDLTKAHLHKNKNDKYILK